MPLQPGDTLGPYEITVSEPASGEISAILKQFSHETT
jgi:hypothetical protein